MTGQAPHHPITQEKIKKKNMQTRNKNQGWGPEVVKCHDMMKTYTNTMHFHIENNTCITTST